MKKHLFFAQYFLHLPFMYNLLINVTCFERNFKRHAVTQTDFVDNTIQIIVIHPNDDIDLLN